MQADSIFSAHENSVGCQGLQYSLPAYQDMAVYFSLVHLSTVSECYMPIIVVFSRGHLFQQI